jgi:predicted nucleic acid-binding protein
VTLLEHDLVLSEPMLAELRKNLAKKFRVPAELITETETALRVQATVVGAPETPLEAPIDPDDALVLGAIVGHADVFVTGDAKLLALEKRAPLPVVSPRQFWTLLRREG